MRSRSGNKRSVAGQKYWAIIHAPNDDYYYYYYWSLSIFLCSVCFKMQTLADTGKWRRMIYSKAAVVDDVIIIRSYSDCAGLHCSDQPTKLVTHQTVEFPRFHPILLWVIHRESTVLRVYHFWKRECREFSEAESCLVLIRLVMDSPFSWSCWLSCPVIPICILCSSSFLIFFSLF